MARTTTTAVQAIMVKTAAKSLTPFIETANSLVTTHCAGLEFTAAQLELIERWLSAHLYQAADPQYESEKIGSTARTRPKTDGKGIMSTRYGQMAVQLGFPSGAPIAIAWLGKEEDE